VAVLKGQDVPVYMGDHALAEHPRIRTLGEEISRVVRGRASNPKWINGVMRHGYKGAFEMAATLDYLFAFAATTRQVENHHFDTLFDHWVEADEVATFIQTHNPDAWQDILKRFQEALDRGLWQPRRNITAETLAHLQKTSHNGKS
jgi:cobaltochelatase CobN